MAPRIDQPHHQLDAFGACFAHVIHVRHAGAAARARRSDDPGTRCPIRLLIKPARGPCSWWLMPPVPQICTFKARRTAPRPCEWRVPELETAPAGRHRVLHDIDRERNDRTRPRVGLAAHQRQRHRQAMIDIHSVDDGEIEIVLDHRLRDVRRQLRMPFHDRHRPRPPAFIGGCELRRAADGEGRNEIEAESRRVIVVDQEDDVGRVLRDPRFRRLVAGEQRLPVVSPVLPRSSARRWPARARCKRWQ